MKLAVVITTVNRPTSSVLELARRLGPLDANLFVAGDSKGPFEYDLSRVPDFGEKRTVLLTINEQQAGIFSLGRLLPTKHYCRKNIGYLHAIRAGAECIYETDDDNAPNVHWQPRHQLVGNPRVLSAVTPSDAGPSDAGPSETRWVNVYSQFSTELVWPRGLPLDRIHAPVRSRDWNQSGSPSLHLRQESGIDCPIQQGLVDGSPDVDAIWRLTQDRTFEFRSQASVIVEPWNWCPFNTQSTWWWSVAYPLLYVPSYCSFRMCDIWKSFVAQRCLWELGSGVAFHSAEVFQDRNLHNLMRDFEDEVPGYLKNDYIARILQSVELFGGREHVGENLRRCYQALVRAEIFPPKELELIDGWLGDLQLARDKK